MRIFSLRGSSQCLGIFGVTIQTGQFIPRKLIKCWNVTESVGLTPVNIFKTIKVNCSILWSAFPVKTHSHSLGARCRGKYEGRRSGLGWDVRGLLVRIDEYFPSEVPTRPSPVVISFLACAADPPHCSYTEQWAQLSPILNQRSVEQRPVWIYYFRRLDRSDSGSFLCKTKFGLSSLQCLVLICLGEKICVGVLVIERYY